MTEDKTASKFPEGDIVISIIELSQPLGEFYVGKINAAKLAKIAAADVRKKVQLEADAYSGIQRELSAKRKKEIRDYISSFDASFPNSFIISIPNDDVIGPEDGKLFIRDSEKTASIIDGQHRLSGFDTENSKNFDLIVSIFVDLPVEDQAMLFATINLKQTKVNPSLVYDLFAETSLRSPQKTCHNISKSLNVDLKSPLHHRIKPLGKKTDEYDGLITQATFVKALLPHVCTRPDEIRDAIKRQKPLSSYDDENQECVFWQYFKENKDWAILKVLTNYFEAVALEFSSDWGSESSPLCKTIGFAALMRLLPELFRLGQSLGGLDLAFFRDRMSKAKDLAPFTFEEYAGGSGQTKIYNRLRERVLNSTDS